MRVVRLTLSSAWAAALHFAIAFAFIVVSFEPAKSGGQSLGFLVMTALFFTLGRGRLRESFRRRDEALAGAPALPAGARRESPLRWLKRQLLGGTLDVTLHVLARYLIFVMVGIGLGLDAAGPIVAGAFASGALANLSALLRFTLVERRLRRRLYEQPQPPERPALLYVA